MCSVLSLLISVISIWLDGFLAVFDVSVRWAVVCWGDGVEFGGVEHCHLVQRAQGCFISRLGVVGCMLLVSGVMGRLSPNAFAFSIVLLFGHLSVVFVMYCYCQGVLFVPVGFMKGLSHLGEEGCAVGWVAGVSSAR